MSVCSQGVFFFFFFFFYEGDGPVMFSCRHLCVYMSVLKITSSYAAWHSRWPSKARAVRDLSGDTDITTNLKQDKL